MLSKLPGVCTSLCLWVDGALLVFLTSQICFGRILQSRCRHITQTCHESLPSWSSASQKIWSCDLGQNPGIILHLSCRATAFHMTKQHLPQTEFVPGPLLTSDYYSLCHLWNFCLPTATDPIWPSSSLIDLPSLCCSYLTLLDLHMLSTHSGKFQA